MINIQIHRVVSVVWLPRSDSGKPRILSITLEDGSTQEITLFSARPKQADPSENGKPLAA